MSYSAMYKWQLNNFGKVPYFTGKRISSNGDVEEHVFDQVVNCGCMGIGKTHCIMQAFGYYLLGLKNKGYSDLSYVLIGKTYNAIKKNMLNVLANFFGEDFKYDHSTKSGKVCDCRLFGFPIFLIALNDANAETRIRGLSNITGAILDEHVLITEAAYSLIISRIRGGKELPEGYVNNWLVSSTNPDSPSHWLLVNYIQPGLVKYIQWHHRDASYEGFTRYINRLKNLYKHIPAFYERYILGRWKSAEGLVFTCFSDQNIANEQMDAEWLQSCRRTFIAVDYGSNHPTSVQSWHVDKSGVRLGSTNKMFRRTAISTIVDYIVELKLRMTNMYGRPVRIPIYYDPAAAAIRDELMKRHIADVLPAKNEHIAGIAYVNNLFDSKQMYILSNTGKETFMSDHYAVKQDDVLVDGTKLTDGTKELIAEIHNYKYKTTAVGTSDDVVKLDDDACDAMRYAVYSDAKYSGEI